MGSAESASCSAVEDLKGAVVVDACCADASDELGADPDFEKIRRQIKMSAAKDVAPERPQANTAPAAKEKRQISTYMLEQEVPAATDELDVLTVPDFDRSEKWQCDGVSCTEQIINITTPQDRQQRVHRGLKGRFEQTSDADELLAQHDAFHKKKADLLNNPRHGALVMSYAPKLEDTSRDEAWRSEQDTVRERIVISDLSECMDEAQRKQQELQDSINAAQVALQEAQAKLAQISQEKSS